MMDRASLNSMVADWIADNGVRRFDRGFSGEWINIRDTLAKLGYEAKMVRSHYSIAKAGSKGRRKLIGREQALQLIDDILIAHGKQPFLRRAA